MDRDAKPSKCQKHKAGQVFWHQGLSCKQAYHFHVWLIDREYVFTRLVRTDKNSFEEKQDRIKLKGVVQFLRLYQERGSEPKEFKRTIREFMHDSRHGEKYKSTMNQCEYAIKSFFDKMDSKIDFSYNKNKFKQRDEEDEDNEPSLNLEELLILLTEGKPSIMVKSIFMTKFHGGMDALALADRFNFYRFSQIAKEFGSSDYNSWDLSLCPIKLNIIRPKTHVKSLICLDYDAIVCLQKWLKDRERITSKPIGDKDYIYINKFGNPIRDLDREVIF